MLCSLFLAGAAWFLSAEHAIAVQWGFSLDDSWIYATFARNLATGHGYSFNPGETTGGATGPLYVFILAGLYWLFHEVVWPAKILGFLCLAGSTLLVYRSVQHIDPRDRVKPLLAGLLTALSPSLLWGSASGMEIPVYLFAVCLGLHAYVRQNWTLAVGAPWSADARYIVYVVPFGLILGLRGLEYFSWRAFRRKSVTALVMLGAVCVIWQIHEARLRGIAHGWNVQNINTMHRFLAERIHQAAVPGDTIAVNDVGAMGYFRGCYVVDLVGLVSPRRTFPENLTHYRPELLAIFPDWFASYGVRDPAVDNIVFYDSDSTYKWSPFLGVGLYRNSIAGRNTMVLFQRLGPDEEGVKDVPLYWH